MREQERILKALANRRRLQIVDFLRRRKEASVGMIAKEIKLSFRATSRHLGVLANADIVDKEQRGLLMLYSLHRARPQLARSVLNHL